MPSFTREIEGSGKTKSVVGRNLGPVRLAKREWNAEKSPAAAAPFVPLKDLFRCAC